MMLFVVKRKVQALARLKFEITALERAILQYETVPPIELWARRCSSLECRPKQLSPCQLAELAEAAARDKAALDECSRAYQKLTLSISS